MSNRPHPYSTTTIACNRGFLSVIFIFIRFAVIETFMSETLCNTLMVASCRISFFNPESDDIDESIMPSIKHLEADVGTLRIHAYRAVFWLILIM